MSQDDGLAPRSSLTVAAAKWLVPITVMIILFWIVMFVGTHSPPLPRKIMRFFDKILHFSGFAILGLLIGARLRILKQRDWKHFTIAAAIVMLYAMIDELTQPLVGRDAEFYDWIADSCGVSLGLAIMYWIPRKTATPFTSPPAESST